MAERTQVTQLVQLGVESTPGTAVAATRQLATLDFDSHVQVGEEEFAPSGFKYLTTVALNREWMQSTIKGKPNYNEMQYLLGSAINTPVITQIMDSATPTGTYRWAFDSNTTGPDNPITYTFEQGSSVRAHRYAYGIVREFGFRHTREATELSGQMIGQRLQDAITLTSGTTQPGGQIVPMVGSQWDIFLDATSGGLGTTKLARALSGAFVLNNRYGPLWVIDSSQTSWATHVEMRAAVQYTTILEADAQGMAQLTALRNNNATRFLRVRAVGPQLYSGGITVNNSFTFDIAVKVGAIEPFSDNQGVYAIGVRFDGVHDPTWNKAYHAELINAVSAF